MSSDRVDRRQWYASVWLALAALVVVAMVSASETYLVTGRVAPGWSPNLSSALGFGLMNALALLIPVAIGAFLLQFGLRSASATRALSGTLLLWLIAAGGFMALGLATGLWTTPGWTTPSQVLGVTLMATVGLFGAIGVWLIWSSNSRLPDPLVAAAAGISLSVLQFPMPALGLLLVAVAVGVARRGDLLSSGVLLITSLGPWTVTLWSDLGPNTPPQVFAATAIGVAICLGGLGLIGLAVFGRAHRRSPLPRVSP